MVTQKTRRLPGRTASIYAFIVPLINVKGSVESGECIVWCEYKGACGFILKEVYCSPRFMNFGGEFVFGKKEHCLRT